MMAEGSPITPIIYPPTYTTSFSTSNTGATLRSCDVAPPFEKSLQLCRDLDYKYGEKRSVLRSHRNAQILPDAPRIALDSCGIVPYCLEDLDTPGMNKLDQKLWNTGPAPSVKTLSHQLTFERRVVVTENPSLHLVWTNNNMLYLKPLPAYLCSYAFWEYISDTTVESINADERGRLRATALGFLRSYAMLIRHRSDFNIARRYELLASFNGTSFEAFIRFISSFDDVLDKDTSPRWRFGELQLDGLNMHSGIWLHRYHFNRFESNHGVYFQRFFPVTLFLFASFSVILSAMQVILAGRQLWDTDNKGLRLSVRTFEWFSIEAIGWALGFGILFVTWWICMACNEGWKFRCEKKRITKRQKEEGIVFPDVRYRV